MEEEEEQEGHTQKNDDNSDSDTSQLKLFVKYILNTLLKIIFRLRSSHQV